MVDFRHLNLIKDFSAIGTFDIVYCRNVLIYFDGPTKTDVLKRLANAMAPDGALLLGAAETILGLTDSLSPDKATRGLYTKAESAAGAELPRLAVARQPGPLSSGPYASFLDGRSEDRVRTGRLIGP